MKLRTKIHTYTTALMLVMLIGADLAVYYVYEKMTYDSEAAHIADRSEDLITLLAGTEDRDEETEMLRAYVPQAGAVTIIQDGNAQLNVQTTANLERIIVNVDDERYVMNEVDDVTFMSTVTPFVWENGKIAQLQMTQSLAETERHLSMLKLVLTLVTIVAMIPILLSNVALARIITQPVTDLITTMRRNKKRGEFEKMTLEKKRNDELYEMSETFNSMIGQIEQNYRKQEQFLSNASHELRTPLTVIESYASLLKRRGTANAAITEEAVDAIASESKRMTLMMEQMLAIAKNKEQPVQVTPVAIHTLLHDIAEQLTQVYGPRYDVAAVEGVCVTDETKLKQLLIIFLDNARRYSEGKIELRAVKTAGGMHISVIDRGEGIPKEQLAHVFERFYRVSEDRNRQSGGTGLGLAIAKQLADRLNIDVTIESEVGVGTTLHCKVPYKLEGFDA
jgi:two-component system, OmpR family, sensor histidine kinase ArlS